MWEKIRSVKKLVVWEKVHTSLFAWVALYAQRGQACSPDSMDSLISLIWPNLAEILACAFKKCERKVRKLKKSEKCEKKCGMWEKMKDVWIKWEMWEKWDVLEKVRKIWEKVIWVRKKWEMWEKVRYVRKSEKSMSKSEIYQIKCENCEKSEKCGKT